MDDKPTVLSVRSSYPLFGHKGFTGSQMNAPCMNDLSFVIRMNCYELPLLIENVQRKAGVFLPSFV